MEKAGSVRGVEAEFEWADVGTWEGLAPFLSSDSCENRFQGRLQTVDANQNLVFCESEEEEVALLGVSGMAVVRSGNRTLIIPRHRLGELARLSDPEKKPSPSNAR